MIGACTWLLMPGQETTGNLFAGRSGACSPQPVFALMEDGARITIDISQRAVTRQVSPQVLQTRHLLFQ